MSLSQVHRPAEAGVSQPLSRRSTAVCKVTIAHRGKATHRDPSNRGSRKSKDKDKDKDTGAPADEDVGEPGAPVGVVAQGDGEVEVTGQAEPGEPGSVAVVAVVVGVAVVAAEVLQEQAGLEGLVKRVMRRDLPAVGNVRQPVPTMLTVPEEWGVRVRRGAVSAAHRRPASWQLLQRTSPS